MKKLTGFLLSLALLIGNSPLASQAAVDWPSDVSVQSEGAIVMDADTGVILWGKNIHTTYYPASITKILTALIVVERCSMDETVAFSYNAVHNVEENSSNAALDVGDELSVRDCLYALLLRSANECANALAEHVAGSMEAFAVLMNEKAASLGCTDSNFANPSGLNDPNHYTSARDMALITQAAFRNENFRMVDTEVYYRLPPTKWVKEGLEFNAHHQMMLRRSPNYYPGVLGGKTGYTQKAGNTLVTYASKNGMNLITVILNGHQTHYPDTKKLLDFGFSRFQSLTAVDWDSSYTLENDLEIAGLSLSQDSVLRLDGDGRITLPTGADFSDTVSSLTYELDESAPSNAVAKVVYSYGEQPVGSAYILAEEPAGLPPFVPGPTAVETEETGEAESTHTLSIKSALKKISLPSLAVLLAAVLVSVLGIGLLSASLLRRKRDQELSDLQQRRWLNQMDKDDYTSRSYYTSVPGRTFSLYRCRRKRRWYERLFRRK